MFFSERTGLQKLLLLKAAAGGSVVEDTATGNPVTFETNVSKALKSLLVAFTPVQEGSGDPAPDNVRNIVPWNGLTVWGAGKNLFDEATHPLLADKWINGTNGVVVSPGEGWSCTDFVDCEDMAGLTVTLNKRPHGNLPGIAFYVGKSSQNFISGESNANHAKNTPWTFTIPTNAKYMRFTVEPGTTDIQLEVSSYATIYEPYKPITETDISFPSPVYGGVLDVVTGEMWETHQEWHGKWSEMGSSTDLTTVTRRSKLLNAKFENITIATGKQCNIADYVYDYSRDSVHYYTAASGEKTHFILFLPIGTDENTEVQFCGKLAEPVLITTLTPAQITALVGNNTIWSDANGDLTVTFLKKG